MPDSRRRIVRKRLNLAIGARGQEGRNLAPPFGTRERTPLPSACALTAARRVTAIDGNSRCGKNSFAMFPNLPLACWRKRQRALLVCILSAAAGCLRAAYPAQDPAASLDLLWQDVWAQGGRNAYVLYMQKEKVPMAATARASFAKELLELAKTPHLSGVAIQSDKSRYYRKEQLPQLDVINGAGFIHFIRPTPKGSRVTERIYLNVHPDHAVEVMRYIVTELLQPESSRLPGQSSPAAAPIRRGITSAKLAGPRGLMTRADSMLIYACSLADAEWAVGCLAEYQAEHRDHFLPDLPAGTRPRLIGVSTAAEPPPALKSASFGSYLAAVAEKAMKTEPAPADFAAFRARVRQLMIDDAVDPDHPDRLSLTPDVVAGRLQN